MSLIPHVQWCWNLINSLSLFFMLLFCLGSFFLSYSVHAFISFVTIILACGVMLSGTTDGPRGFRAYSMKELPVSLSWNDECPHHQQPNSTGLPLIKQIGQSPQVRGVFFLIFGKGKVERNYLDFTSLFKGLLQDIKFKMLYIDKDKTCDC